MRSLFKLIKNTKFLEVLLIFKTRRRLPSPLMRTELLRLTLVTLLVPSTELSLSKELEVLATKEQ